MQHGLGQVAQQYVQLRRHPAETQDMTGWSKGRDNEAWEKDTLVWLLLGPCEVILIPSLKD